MENLRRYIVIEDWSASYENPIILKKNEGITVDLSITDSDPEWKDWVWCIADTGMDGWVPIQILEISKNPHNKEKLEAIVLEDYSAYELSVNKNDIIIGSKVLNGWIWCRKECLALEGWVPLRNVEVVID